MNYLRKCEICPRECKIDRYTQKGYCKASNKLRVALYSLHMWEEPCISGTFGSGTIFFSYCNLKCVYCQNYKISFGYGKDISIKRFVDMCIELQNKKAHNINLVTPTHYVTQVIKGIKQAKKNGLNIPIIYNTSGYEQVNTIKLLTNTVDIYLTDFKYYDNLYGKKYSNVDNYCEIAKLALEEMYNQVGNPIIEKGIMIRGIIVRVLRLPGLVDDAKKILKYLYDTYKDNIYISIMNQYTPVRKTKFKELNRTVTIEEYYELVNYACDLGITNAFIQEDGTQTEGFIPNFNKEGV